jgi:bifunctional DNA-binding transcriptional regulator/antitoxin component of YhaV-PrlF toxin-antitoxin module
MAQSTITDSFQKPLPLEVRLALKLEPRQRLSYEVRPDGSAVIRPVPRTCGGTLQVTSPHPMAVSSDSEDSKS